MVGLRSSLGGWRKLSEEALWGRVVEAAPLCVSPRLVEGVVSAAARASRRGSQAGPRPLCGGQIGCRPWGRAASGPPRGRAGPCRSAGRIGPPGPARSGRASDGPPSDGPPSDGPPSDGPPSDGPPSDGPPGDARALWPRARSVADPSQAAGRADGVEPGAALDRPPALGPRAPGHQRAELGRHDVEALVRRGDRPRDGLLDPPHRPLRSAPSARSRRGTARCGARSRARRAAGGRAGARGA